jgi:serine phosphatase RsbU (regulator of sigma subunit)
MLYAMLAATNIRCFARMGYQPYRIAAETNNQLAGGVKGDKELTVEALIVQLDLRDGTVKYVNAGMPPILVKGTGESFTYENTPVGFNLGEMPGVSFTQEMLHLSQGNMLLMMSNGVPGMKNESGLEFTNSYVQSGINEITTKVYDLREMTEQLETMLADFRGGAELESDTSMILLRYFG